MNSAFGEYTPNELPNTLEEISANLESAYPNAEPTRNSVLRDQVVALNDELDDERKANYYLAENQVPNVVIENPGLRKAIGLCLDLALLGVVTVVAVDAAAPAFDLNAITLPALAAISTLRAGFGFVQNANTPKP